jgi:hypothetical protein
VAKRSEIAAPPREPTDDEYDAHPDFWDAVTMARGLFDPQGLPGGGGTFEDLSYWYQSADSANAPTLLMRQWLAHLLYSLPDRRARGGSHDGPTKRQPRTEALNEVARRVAAQQRDWLHQNHRARVPVAITGEMIAREIQSGQSPQHDLLRQQPHEMLIEDVLSALRHRNRL